MARLTPLLALLLALCLCRAASATEPTAPAAAPATDADARALTLPAPLKLRYTIYGKVGFLPYRAGGFLSWTHDGARYDARMEVEVFLLGSRVQTSQGRISAAGLQPLRFVDRVNADRTVEFDYPRQRILFSEGTPPEPLSAGAQDQLSVFIQLGALIGAAPQRYPAGSVITLAAMGIYGPETWRFNVVGEESLHLPGGEVRTLRLSRPPARGDDPSADIWLAPSLGWLPARIRLSQPNGDYIDQRWRGSETP